MSPVVIPASHPLAAVLLAACVLALGGCASWKPGEDPDGVAARARAQPVLPALVKYRKDRGEYPSSLQELAPRYLAEVPFDPGLRYDRDLGTVEFAYFPSWPHQEPVACAAKVGELDWTCEAP
jgi:hypothetical protein